MKRMVLVFAAAVAAMASGCVVEVDDTRLIYETCDFDSDCEAATDGCFGVTVNYGTHVASDNMCSLNCASHAECIDNGRCYDVGGSGVFICYQSCFDDLDCPAFWSCISTVGGVPFDAICLPD